jgi:two-component system chemotaxis sensor kinase CheA
MATREEEFLQRLHAAFAIEAAEHLSAMSSGLLALEKAEAREAQAPLVEEIFREAHSLKGAARAVNIAEIETICQALEDIFAGWKKHGATLAPTLFDVLHKSLDLVDQTLQSPSATASQIPPLLQRLEHAASEAQSAQSREVSNPASATNTDEEVETGQNGNRNGFHAPTVAPASTSTRPQVPSRLEPSVSDQAATIPAPASTSAPAEQPPSASPPPQAAAPKSAAETVRIATAKLDALLLQVEELLAIKLTTEQRAVDLREARTSLQLWHREWASIAGEARALRRGIDKSEQQGGAPIAAAPIAATARLVEFLEWNREYIKAMEGRMSELSRACDHDRRTIGGLVDGLLENSKKLVMLPFSTLLGLLPKMVRDLARDQAKDVEIVLRGGDVEIDKRILEEMKDALLHLLRNAVDHGIEAPQARLQSGKRARATIAVSVTQSSGNEVEISIADDGGGIDVERVKASAISHGFLAASEAEGLSPDHALDLIFQSEVSSSPILTEISGRGLGMAIVREKIQKLGGRIEIETRAGEGTTFRIALPLTLTTFRGILVQVEGQTFVLPVSGVERVLRLPEAEARTVGSQATVRLQRAQGPQVVPLLSLAEILKLSPGQSAPQIAREAAANSASPLMPLVVLSAGERAVAFRVDAILNEQEVLVKKLSAPLLHVRHISGATVLGSGQAVLILHAADLMQSAARARHAVAAPQEEEAQAKAILVVEDSITSRMLLKNILEGAGYSVSTAVDGMDALSLLSSNQYDLVVSDVDMPRLNGFDLTTKIREDARLSELPWFW